VSYRMSCGVVSRWAQCDEQHHTPTTLNNPTKPKDLPTNRGRNGWRTTFSAMRSHYQNLQYGTGWFSHSVGMSRRR
ncbi:hypothetical protein, partial [Corynebacterium durum]|uniref:hypothetical protein n=1 Tax=Corynebacterium durum TaxID=61592 RepID=UPI0028F0856E